LCTAFTPDDKSGWGYCAVDFRAKICARRETVDLAFIPSYVGRKLFFSLPGDFHCYESDERLSPVEPNRAE
jgi:hypothetical protein